MGKSDVILKQWLRNKVRFTDLFNAVVFDGKQVIKPEELEELNSESEIVIANTAGEDDSKDTNDRNKKYNPTEKNASSVRFRTEHRYRDLVMR